MSLQQRSLQFPAQKILVTSIIIGTKTPILKMSDQSPLNVHKKNTVTLKLTNIPWLVQESMCCTMCHQQPCIGKRLTEKNPGTLCSTPLVIIN